MLFLRICAGILYTAYKTALTNYSLHVWDMGEGLEMESPKDTFF